MLKLKHECWVKASARRPKASSAAKAKQLRPTRTALADRPRTAPIARRKEAVFTRGGQVRTQPVRDVSARTLRPIITENINKASTLGTDEALVNEKIGMAFVAHGMAPCMPGLPCKAPGGCERSRST
jgi:hypothetical protein